MYDCNLRDTSSWIRPFQFHKIMESAFLTHNSYFFLTSPFAVCVLALFKLDSMDNSAAQLFTWPQNQNFFLVITKNVTLIELKVQKWLKTSSKQFTKLHFTLKCKIFLTNFGLCRTEVGVFLLYKMEFQTSITLD